MNTRTEKPCRQRAEAFEDGLVRSADIRLIPTDTDDSSRCYVPTLPGNFAGEHEAKALEAAIAGVVARQRDISVILGSLQNAMTNLERASVGPRDNVWRERIAVNQFNRDACLELLRRFRPAGMDDEALSRLWFVSGSGNLLVAMMTKDGVGRFGQSNSKWCISWRTGGMMEFGYIGGKAPIPSWSAGLWSLAAESLDRLVVCQ